ncbi:hypothetical protein [Streptomyces sp. NPDC059009]|uniref:hypothetical protein n=1 Tax=Streptomyces sp. NPDC059009 TaxID=3346694 RepID=UPI003680A255
MSAWRTSGLRAVVASGLAAAMAVTVAGTAQAAPVGDGPGPDDWGTVVETKDGVQANSWLIGVTGLGRIVNARLFESASPTTPKAPKDEAGGKELINLAPGGFGLGKASALYSRAMTNSTPANSSGGKVVAPGVAYGGAGAASVDVGVPYIQPTTPEGTQLSGIGLHINAIDVHAMAVPGKAVQFEGGAASGYLSIAGQRLIDIPRLWAVNLGLNIPSGKTGAPIALAMTNEQITTDNKGVPTLGKDGDYKYDPKATSGYVNGIHVSVLGQEVADITVAHAAVIRDAAKTDSLVSKLPKQLPTLADLAKDAMEPKKPMVPKTS